MDKTPYIATNNIYKKDKKVNKKKHALTKKTLTYIKK